MNKIVLFLLCFASLWADRSGPYLGVGYALSSYDDDGFRKDNGYTKITDDRPKVLRVYAGAYINEYFSVELDYSEFDASEAKNSAGQSIDTSFYNISVSTVVHYPTWENQLDWYAKFGAGELRWRQRGEKNSTDEAGGLLVGAGAGYRLTQRLTFKMGYDIVFFGLEESTLNKKYNMDLGLFFGAVEVQF